MMAQGKVPNGSFSFRLGKTNSELCACFCAPWTCSATAHALSPRTQTSEERTRLSTPAASPTHLSRELASGRSPSVASRFLARPSRLLRFAHLVSSLLSRIARANSILGYSSHRTTPSSTPEPPLPTRRTRSSRSSGPPCLEPSRCQPSTARTSRGTQTLYLPSVLQQQLTFTYLRYYAFP